MKFPNGTWQFVHSTANTLHRHLTIALSPAEPLRNVWFFCKGTKNKGTSSTPITRFISATFSLSIGNKVYDFSTLLLAICLGFGLAPRLFSSTRAVDPQVRPSLYSRISRTLVLQKRHWINNLPRVHPPWFAPCLFQPRCSRFVGQELQIRFDNTPIGPRGGSKSLLARLEKGDGSLASRLSGSATTSSAPTEPRAYVSYPPISVLLIIVYRSSGVGPHRTEGVDAEGPQESQEKNRQLRSH